MNFRTALLLTTLALTAVGAVTARADEQPKYSQTLAEKPSAKQGRVRSVGVGGSDQVGDAVICRKRG